MLYRRPYTYETEQPRDSAITIAVNPWLNSDRIWLSVMSILGRPRPEHKKIVNSKSMTDSAVAAKCVFKC